MTGEGRLDRTFLQGNVVGGVVERARAGGVPALVVVGQVRDDADELLAAASPGVEVVALDRRFGIARPVADPIGGLRTVVAEYLGRPVGADRTR